MFRTVPLSVIRSFSLYTATAVPSWSCSLAVSKPVWQIPLLCVQWKTPGEGQRNCLKHVEFYSKNKFEKLVHLVGFIIGTKYIVKYICVKPIYSTHTFFSPAGPSSRKTINVAEKYWRTEEWHCQVRLPVLYYVEVPLFSSHPLTACGRSVLILLASSNCNLYDIHHCCVYSEKLMMMDRGTVRNM